MWQPTETPLHLTKEARRISFWYSSLGHTIEEVAGHCMSAGSIQGSATRLQQVSRAREIDGAYRNQFMNVPWSKLPSLVIRKSARRAIVTAVAQFASDDTCSFGGFPKGNPASLARSLNELTDATCRERFRKQTWHLVALQCSGNHGLPY